MTETTETLPSIKDLEKGGIALRVNQGDIIDLIASSQIQGLQLEIEQFFREGAELKKEYEEKKEKILEIQSDKIKTALEKTYKKAGLNVRIDSISLVRYYSTTVSRDYLMNVSTTTQFKFERYSEEITQYTKIEAKFRLMINVPELSSEPISTEGSYRTPNDVEVIDHDFVSRINDYNSRIDEFLMKYNNFNFSLVKKSIKSEFTKKILENSPEEFKKSLLKNFNIAI